MRGRASTAPSYDGLLLAGGRSRRMGRDKRLVQFHGRPLVAHAARALRAAVTSGACYVATGSSRVRLPGTHGMVALTDEPPNKGPLGGIAAALARTPAGVVVIACDTPLVRPQLLVRLGMLGVRTDRPVAVRSARGWEPLIAYYPRWVLNHVRAAIDEGRLAPHALLDRLPTLAIRFIAHTQLVNVNRPEDLVMLDDGVQGPR